MDNPKRLAVSGRMWAKSLFLFKKIQPELELVDASEFIASMRAVKDEEEIALMKEAGKVTDRVFASVLKRLQMGMTAYDIAREVDHQIMLHGGEGVSFHTGITIAGDVVDEFDGENGNRTLLPGTMVAFDFGIVLNGYVSDFGRTVFCGKPDEQIERYHDLVMKSQSAAIQEMKSGQITASELNQLSRDVLAEEGADEYFTHRLGHGIGIDVHEPPFLYELDHTVLRSGMCFTIEPSIRIDEQVAVRVEDVVQVTKQSGVPFSNFSRELLVI